MGRVVAIKTAVKPNLEARTLKVTLTALALAMEYFTKTVPDPVFVKEAKSCLLRHDDDLVCLVTPEMYAKVSKDMPVAEAVKSLLYG